MFEFQNTSLGRMLRPRLGVKQSVDRLFHQPNRIGYLGASITAQRDGFRPRVHEWLCKVTGNDHTAANAGLGANGSLCSVFVMDELILKHRPALCFVECAVADMALYTPAHEVGPVVEGIVRKLADSNCSVIFLYMYRDDAESIAATHVIPAYEQIAEHYGIPSIHLGAFIKNEITRGAYQAGDLFKDGIHTTEVGANVSANAIANALKDLFADTSSNAENNFQSHVQRLPYVHARNFHYTSVVRCETEMLEKENEGQRGLFRHFTPFLQVGTDNPIHFAAEHGEIVGILAVVGKDSGVIEVSTSDFSESYQLLDPWYQADRIQAIVFKHYVQKAQSVTIRLLNCAIDYENFGLLGDEARAPKSLRIIGFLVRGKDLSYCKEQVSP